jgi:hypothetical protein
MGLQQRTRGRIPGSYLVVIAIAALAWAAFGSSASASARSPSFSVQPKGLMQPDFAKRKHDYAVRCQPKVTELRVEGAKGWRIRIGHGSFQRRDIVRKLHANSEAATNVAFRKANGKRRTYHLRCLPGDFPAFSFDREAPGGPKLFSMQLGGHYAAIFDRNGVPVWWYRASGEPDNFQVLSDGTLAFDPVDEASFQTGDYEIRTLKGRLLRVVRGAHGAVADIHEIQLLPNGNYLIGAQVKYQADTSAFGGSADSTVLGIQIQELTPDGDLVWHWESRGHIGLDETGRWWDNQILDDQPYDIVHWNSAELVGKHRLLVSFRHLDAVYEIDRRSGDIVWKLGGTETPESLDVTNDPRGEYPLGGQHDARIEPDGTLTVHDNSTGLGEPPRAVRYRIDAKAGTARLIQSIADPDVPDSFCCGSARRLDSGDWLIGWGGQGLVGGYDADGERLFGLQLAVGFSYRANPVPAGVITMSRLRAAMDAIASRP